MKNRFDFRRFVRVLRLSWQTQPVLPYIVLVAAVPLLYLYFLGDARNVFVSLRSDNSFLAFNAYFCIAGWIYAGMAYNELGKQSTAVQYLLAPASTFEKWLAQALLALVVFPLITWLSFNLAFKVFELISVRLFAFRYPAIDWFSRDMRVTFFFFYLSLPAAYASGLIWKRFGMLKGLVFVFVLLLILFQVIRIGVEKHPYDSGWGALLQEINMPFLELDCDDATRRLVGIFWVLAAYVPSLLLLAASYFLIREKEL